MAHTHWFTDALHDACRSFWRISAAYLFGFWCCFGLGQCAAAGRFDVFPAPWELYLLIFRAVTTVPGFIVFFLAPVCWYSSFHRRQPRDVLIWWGICQLLWFLAGCWIVWTFPHHYWPERYAMVEDWYTPFLRSMHLE